MHRVKVESSDAQSIGYDEAHKILEVEYKKDGSIYQYEGVSKRTFTNLLNTSSVGGYLHRNVIPKKDGKRIK